MEPLQNPSPHPISLETPIPLKSRETSPSPSNFSFTITRVAVSQICQSIGFKGSKTSALETLTNIATIYLQTLAKSAASIAASSGRTESNLLDLIYALEDLASVQGFSGASNVHKSLLRSTTLIDIMNFVESIDEIPFAKPIPKCNKWEKLSSYETGDLEQKSHIPRWLPPFPDPSTHKTRDEIQICRKRFRWPQNSDIFAEQNSGIMHANCKEEEGGELPAERERVRFKMWLGGEGLGVGVDSRNGICRGKNISTMFGWRELEIREENGE